MDYVSCSPFRVPIARLAAAQAAIRGQGEGEREKGKPPRQIAKPKKTAARKPVKKTTRKTIQKAKAKAGKRRK
jgi:hypothetical protein